MGIKSSQQKGLTGLDESLFKNQGRKSIGGTITYSNGYIIHTFTGSGQLTVLDSSLNVEYLLVAGGGAGGGYHGGGGGAGGVLSGTLTLSKQSYTIVIGGGGTAATNINGTGNAGDNSTFGGLTAYGGGSGISQGNEAVTKNNGGSGGGGCDGGASVVHYGGTGVIGQGNSGGYILGSGPTQYYNYGTPGGGGAGGNGIGNIITGGGVGGPGIQSSISGTATYYGGGGGGTNLGIGTYGSLDSGDYGIGGVGGGGNGGAIVSPFTTPRRSSTSGSSNTGGGGGGYLYDSQGGGAGGSGILIIRYKTEGLSINNSKLVTNNLILDLDANNNRSFSPLLVECLIVGGGAAGTTDLKGGGGGGGVLYFSGLKTLTDVSYTITVGGGGSSASGGSAGVASSAFGETASGGQIGTSSAGGASGTATLTGRHKYGLLISGSNKAGGTDTGNASSGGGGAGGVGGGTTGNNNGGAGGVGLPFNIYGTSYYWAGGGGGASYGGVYVGGTGGLGGGGGGGGFALNGESGGPGGAGFNNGVAGTTANSSLNGGAAGANTGGGGGAGSHTGGGQTSSTGGNGGSGIVIIRYLGPQQATGGTVTTSGNFTVHTFTGSSTFTLTNTTWVDNSGYGNHCTLSNGPIYSNTNGGGIVFDGSNDYATTTLTGVNLDYGNTIECVVKRLTTPPAWRTYFNIKPSGANVPFYEFRTTGANLETVLDYYNPGNATDYYTTTYTIDTTNYWHLVGTYDGITTTTFYVNGNLIGTGTTASFALGYSPKLTIARSYGDDRNTDIVLPICRVYNRPLTSSEVLQNFNELRGKFGI